MKLVCINCPRGCNLTVDKVNDEIIVEGNMCPRGKTYAINELTNPLRTLTTTIDIESIDYDRLPVITSMPIPKDKMFMVMKFLKGYKVKAPINRNDVIIKDICNLGVDLIASKTILK